MFIFCRRRERNTRPCLAQVRCAVFAPMMGTHAAGAQDAAFRIDLAHHNGPEQRAREQLLRILRQHQVAPWMFTREIRIDSRAEPHSHPVLTVNTRYLKDDTAQLAAFLHEQIHWFLAGRARATEAVIADLRRIYPDAPAMRGRAVKSKESTYLHCLVGALTLEALIILLGESPGRAALARLDYYRWIHKRVLADRPAVVGILRAHALNIAAPSPR